MEKKTDEWEVRTFEQTMEKYPDAWIDKTPPIPEITKSTIRRFAFGIGDDNPLWLDEEHGESSKHGGLLAPPSIVVGCGAMGIIRGQVPPSAGDDDDDWDDDDDDDDDEDVVAKGPADMSAIHGWYSGSRIRWFKNIHPNDHLTNLNYIHNMEVKPTEFAGDNSMVLTFGVDLFNPQKELVCRMYNWDFVGLRKETQKQGKYMSLELKEKWSDEELKEIWDQYEKEYEQLRGAKTRYWEDVEIGEEWKMLKGPYTPTSGIAYIVGAVGETFVRTDRLMYKTLVRDHPSVGIKNRQNVPEPPVRVHWEGELVTDIGIPAAYDFGGQRIAWLSQIVTDWMGDDGFLKTLEGKFLRFNYIGDVQWFTAKAVDKFKEGDEHLIKCDIESVNQRGEITTKGYAVVALPAKG
ncbi:MAG: hypothetical protein GY847_18835 [Proteobacteria bacterium]|nr:hypothetical protein [Pseudomonadota bacterium]